jgi:hypothetical protein
MSPPDDGADDVTTAPEAPDVWTGPDSARGQYLCERCQDVMTDEVVPAAVSPTGVEMALCRVCQRGEALRPQA